MANKSFLVQLSTDELLEIVELGARKAIEKHAKENEIETLLTREEAALILKVTPQTVSIYVNKGLITNYGLKGRKQLFRKEELLAAKVKISKSNWRR